MMEKAKVFEDYFTDSQLSPGKLERMQLTRKLVHELYPEVEERVSYAMPGFYPKTEDKKVKINAQKMLFFVMANKNWLGIYGVPEIELSNFKGLTMGKGSLRVPYNFPEDEFKKLLTFVIAFNLKRHGLK